MVPECCVCHASLDVVCDVSEYGMCVCVSLTINVFVECLVLNPCCVVMFGMLCVLYGRITVSSIFAITDRRDIGNREHRTHDAMHPS